MKTLPSVPKPRRLFLGALIAILAIFWVPGPAEAQVAGAASQRDPVHLWRLIIPEIRHHLEQATCRSLTTASDLSRALSALVRDAPQLQGKRGEVNEFVGLVNSTMSTSGCRLGAPVPLPGTWFDGNGGIGSLGGGPGVADSTVPELVLATLHMSEAEREVFEQRLPEESQFALEEWRESNAETYEALDTYIDRELLASRLDQWSRDGLEATMGDLLRDDQLSAEDLQETLRSFTEFRQQLEELQSVSGDN